MMHPLTCHYPTVDGAGQECSSADVLCWGLSLPPRVPPTRGWPPPSLRFPPPSPRSPSLDDARGSHLSLVPAPSLLWLNVFHGCCSESVQHSEGLDSSAWQASWGEWLREEVDPSPHPGTGSKGSPGLLTAHATELGQDANSLILGSGLDMIAAPPVGWEMQMRNLFCNNALVLT